MDEQWKEVGIQKYMISNYGNVKNQNGEKEMKPQIVGSGHCQICFMDNNKPKRFYIHRLVAKHFLDRPDDDTKCIIDHIDQNKTNNLVSNLRWVSHKENANNRHDSREKTERILKQNEYARLWRINNKDKTKVYQTKYTKNGEKEKIMKACREKSKELIKQKIL